MGRDGNSSQPLCQIYPWGTFRKKNQLSILRAFNILNTNKVRDHKFPCVHAILLGWIFLGFWDKRNLNFRSSGRLWVIRNKSDSLFLILSSPGIHGTPKRCRRVLRGPPITPMYFLPILATLVLLGLLCFPLSMWR